MRENRLNRQPSGPGRRTRRTRSSAPVVDDAPRTEPSRAAPVPTSVWARAAARVPRPRNRLGFTRRALVLAAVVAVLGLSYASSLRVWVVQGQELATANAAIARHESRIAEMEDELERWRDPAYVRAQARQRLGWVMPGDVGYRVVGTDGEVLSGTTEIEGVGASQTSQLAARWWDKLALSMRHADETPPPTDPLVTPESTDGAADETSAEAPPDAGAPPEPAGR